MIERDRVRQQDGAAHQGQQRRRESLRHSLPWDEAPNHLPGTRARKGCLSTLRPLILIIYLALLGVLCVYAASVYLGSAPSLALGTVSVGIICFIYIINRFSDTREDRINDADTYAFFQAHRYLGRIAFVSAALLIVSLIALRRLHPYIVCLIVLGVLYSSHLIPWYRRGEGLSFHRLKEVPLLKNLLVSLLWGISVFAVPLLFTGCEPADRAAVAVLTAGLVLSTFNNTVFGDIRDIAGDRSANNWTLPVLIGVRQSYLGLGALNALWLTTLAILATHHVVDGRHILFLLILALYPLVYILPHESRALPHDIVEVLSESDLLVYGVGLFMLSLPQG